MLAATYGVDVAALAVKISEGALYPNATLTASASYGSYPAFEVVKQTAVSVLGTLTVPIYQGGAEYSAIRQSKETLGQQRLNLDINRDQARATVVQSWGQLDAAKAQIEATTAQVNAAEIALNGVREEAQIRAAHDARRAQRAAGTGQCPRRARHRPARSRGGLVHLTGGRRRPLDAAARPRRFDLRSASALPTSARCVDRACATPTADR